MIVIQRRCFRLRRLNIFILVDDGYVIERLPKADVLIFILELLLIIVRCTESHPGECVYKERMLLQIFLQRVLFRDESRVVIIVDIYVIILQGIVVYRLMPSMWRWGDRGHSTLVLSILCIVQLFVIIVVQREIGGVLMPRGGISGAPFFARTERQHCPHIAGGALLLLLLSLRLSLCRLLLLLLRWLLWLLWLRWLLRLGLRLRLSLLTRRL